MLPKTILCIIGNGERLDNAKRAITMAEQAQLHLSFAVIGVALPPPAAVSYAVPMDAWTEEREGIVGSVRAKAGEIEKLLQASAVSGDVSQHYLPAGAASSVSGMRARYCDLAMVFAETEDNARIRSQALQGLLFEGGVPFLHVPEAVTPTVAPRNMLVAWNGSLEAARAVHASLDMLSGASSVTVAMVDPVSAEWGGGEEPGFDIGRFLARHGIDVDVERISGGGRDPAEVILGCARDRGADMVVMGAYGHSRLREYVFGGMTREMLARSQVQVLMMH